MREVLHERSACDILRVQAGRAVCPRCGRKTGQRIRPDTVLLNFPLFCKNCRAECLVNTESLSL